MRGIKTARQDAGITEKTWVEVKRDVIADALRRHGSVRAAASALGRPKSTLADRARRYGLSTRFTARR